jgi:nucleoside-diphosphate-sugar epimerase
VKIAVTGADGFLGTHLCEAFLARGWQVYGLVRNPERKRVLPGVIYRHYAFPADLSQRDDDVDVIVHCAFAMQAVDARRYAMNREAALFLRRQYPGTRMVFISSMSAHEGAESLYGREKLHIESTLDASRDAWIRPGFIIGNGGVFKNLAGSIRKLPLIPLFYGGMQPIQTVHVEDLTECVCAVVERGICGLIRYGEREAVLLRDFYAAIAAGLGVKRPLVRLPGALTLAGLRMAEGAGLRLPMTSQNLLGLKHLIRVDAAADIARLGLPEPRVMGESLSGVDWGVLCRS